MSDSESIYKRPPSKVDYFDQGLVVLQGRSIRKNLSKVAWFFVGKKGVIGQIWDNLFWDICDKFYLQKLW